METSEQKAENFIQRIKLNSRYCDQQAQACYLGLGSSFEAITYLGLGSSSYVTALAEKVTPCLRDVAAQFPDNSKVDVVIMVKKSIIHLEAASSLAKINYFGFKKFSWDNIWNLPVIVKKPLGIVMRYVLDDEVFCGRMEGKTNSLWWLHNSVALEFVSILRTIILKGGYECSIKETVIPIVVPSEAITLARKVFADSLKTCPNPKTIPRQYDLLSPLWLDIIRNKQQVELCVAKLLVEKVMNYYLMGLFQKEDE